MSIPTQLKNLADARAKATQGAEWLVDAIATATQDRKFLRGDPNEDTHLTEVILLNGGRARRWRT